jgi:uncharacterized protein YndB with AHSA1/START domain
MESKTKITVEVTAKVPVEKAWNFWNAPEHITHWCAASDDWHAPKAENDLRVGGKFTTRMEAKDGSFGFDFGGTYTEVKANARIAYIMDDGRKAEIDFIKEGDTTKVIETFEAESENPVEMQKGGWQAILNNFKKYAESH